MLLFQHRKIRTKIIHRKKFAYSFKKILQKTFFATFSFLLLILFLFLWLKKAFMTSKCLRLTVLTPMRSDSAAKHFDHPGLENFFLF